MTDQVILVNENDVEIGTLPKLEAHQKGLLHRALSVFIFNSKREMLLQQRALDKYHSAGLWSNTCCSHPYPAENTLAAANRRLMEEMGIQTELRYLHSFRYKTQVDNNLIEHELDHVFSGICDKIPAINKKEVADYKYISIPELLTAVKKNPEDYTPWFKICLQEVLKNSLSIGKSEFI
jgi:isopentenyl-diphosphate Delta-isomerase